MKKTINGKEYVKVYNVILYRYEYVLTNVYNMFKDSIYMLILL